ncbi:MAG: extracellular solute-binding protein [Anaerolineaceae bacterium]|nr:extracellular solute-binding protein [Anaerolineaceae bacterium]
MRKTYALFSFVLILALLAACQPAATPPLAATKAPSAPEATKAVEPTVETPASKTTLVVWDQFYRGVESEVIDQLNQEFEEAHPGVTVERVSKVQEDLATTVKLALSQADGPDVAQVNQGRSDMGALVQADLLLSLNDYASKYGWGKRFSSSVSSRNSFTADGKFFGEGNLYGVSPTAEVVGVYYNKGIFKENGWEIPATFADFEQLLANIKAKGITPIVFGDLDGWPGIHEFSSVQHVLVDSEYINDFTYAVNNVSFDTEANREAAGIMQEWVEQGYFTDGFMGIGYDDSAQLFKAGDGALMITGSWLSGELTTDTDLEFGFFLMPQQTADKPQLAIGGVGIPYSIRKTTQNPDLAAEYLDWMVSERAAQLWAEASFVPAMPLPATFSVKEGSLFADTVKAWDKINKDNGVGHYIDWATPTFYDTINAELQKLFGLEIDPAAFAKNVEKDYGAFLASQK